MATYVLPQVLVFQDFKALPAAAVNQLKAHIAGPHAQLIRYAETDERDLGFLGAYDWLTDTDYPWPERPAGGIVDFPYVKLWMKDALLQYFEEAIGQSPGATKVTGYNNRVHAGVNLVDNGTTYPRNAAVLRDVQPGDVAKVRGVNGASQSVTLWTYVQQVLGDAVPSSVGAASSDSANAANQGASTAVTQIAGAGNCVRVAVDGSLYNGLTSGFISETYDVLVTQSSANNNYTTATLRILSGSGSDDVASMQPAAAGVPFTIGTRGLKVTLSAASSAACSDSASSGGVSPDDLIAGQRWHIVVNQAFTVPTPTSGGTYTGLNDTTYIVTVYRGGDFASATKPQVLVSTNNGVDMSGPTPVNASGAGGTINIGTLGATMYFTGAGLRKGDRYYAVAVASHPGNMRTVVLGHNLDTTIPANSAVDLTLFIRKPLLQVTQNRIGFAPLTNWDTSVEQLTVNNGIVAYDPEWVNSNGAQVALPVVSEASVEYGLLYAEVRYWIQTLCHEVNGITDVGSLDDSISGALDPDNPLKWGVFQALQNSNGSEVLFSSVCDPSDPNAWDDVLGLLLGRDDVYSLVPLTRDKTILDLYAAHVDDASSPAQGLWRTLWTNLQGVPEIPVVSVGSTVQGHTQATTTDGKVALGVVEDDPLETGSQFLVLRCTSSNANFLANGVRAGDIVRLLYTNDGFGNETYSEFIVDRISTEDQLHLLAGPDTPISIPAQFEIWRNLTATEEAEAIATYAGSWGNRRVRLCGLTKSNLVAR